MAVILLTLDAQSVEHCLFCELVSLSRVFEYYKNIVMNIQRGKKLVEIALTNQSQENKGRYSIQNTFFDCSLLYFVHVLFAIRYFNIGNLFFRK